MESFYFLQNFHANIDRTCQRFLNFFYLFYFIKVILVSCYLSTSG